MVPTPAASRAPIARAVISPEARMSRSFFEVAGPEDMARRASAVSALLLCARQSSAHRLRSRPHGNNSYRRAGKNLVRLPFGRQQGVGMADKLSTYRAKRDFGQTAEPKGARARALTGVGRSSAATFRHPETCGEAAPLRFAARARRRVQVLGSHARPVARSGRQATGRGSRGPSPRIRRLRRHYPAGPIWRRHRAALGPRLLVAIAGHRSAAGPEVRRTQIHARGRASAWQLGARADAP